MTSTGNIYITSERLLRSLSIPKLFLMCFAISLLWHYVLYGVTFWFDFGKDDDYFFFSYDKTFGFENHPQWGWWPQTGRYGSGEMWKHLSLLITDLADLSKIRAMSLLVSSVSMTLLVLSFVRVKSNILFALFISALIFSLPAMALNFTYVLGFPSTVAWMCALLAFLSSFALFGNRLAPAKFGLREILGTILAFSFLGISITIYQMSMFFFLIPCAYFVLFADRDKFISGQSAYKKIWSLIFPMVMTFTVAISYYVYHKFVYLPKFFAQGVGVPVSAEQSEIAAYRFDASSNYVENLQHYIEHTVPRIFDIVNWNEYPDLWLFIAGLIILPVIIGSCACLKSKNPAELKKYYDSALIAVTVCGYFLLSSAPIVAQGTHSTYRVVLVMSAIVFLAFVWAALWLLIMMKADSRSTKLILSCSLLVTVLISTHITVIATTRSEAFEIEYVATQVRQFLKAGKPLHRIHLIQSGNKDRFSDRGCESEFFCGSSRNGAHFVWAIKAAIEKEIGEQKDINWTVWSNATSKRTGLTSGMPYQNYNSPVLLTYALPDEPLPREDGLLVIDLSTPDRRASKSLTLRHAMVRESQKDREIIEKVTFKDGQTHIQKILQINQTRRNAFDGGISSDRFWEMPGRWPIELALDFLEPRTVSKYSFYSHNAGERMPKSWKLEALDVNDRSWWSNEIPSYVGSQKVNVVAFNGGVYSVPALLKTDLGKIKGSNIYNSPGAFVKEASSFGGAIAEDSRVGSISSAEVKILDSTTVNIVEFAGKFYSVPQSIGEISLEQWRQDEVAFLPGVFTKPSDGEGLYGTWIEIDERELEKPWLENEKKTFSVEGEKKYKNFRWTFTEGFNPGVMRLYEITVE